jgi:hypothetical protein
VHADGWSCQIHFKLVTSQFLCISLQFYFLYFSKLHTHFNNAFKVYFTKYWIKSWIVTPYISSLRLLGLRVRVPPRAFRSVCCECCVMSGRRVYVSLIARPEESYRMCCFWVWSWSPVRVGHDPESGRSATGKLKSFLYHFSLRMAVRNRWNILTSPKCWRIIKTCCVTWW